MNNERSRMDRYNKRRKNRRMISILLAIGSMLVILFIVVLLLDNKGDKPTANKENESQTVEKKEIIINEQTESNDTPSDDQSETEELEIETVTSSDDNVVEAFTAEWEPIGTSQSEPHTVDYNANSKDREEMERAIQLATGLDDMTIWWIGNDGEQKVVSTVSPIDKSKTYRVYLTWEENRGWQPTLVEVLKVNDRA